MNLFISQDIRHILPNILILILAFLLWANQSSYAQSPLDASHVVLDGRPIFRVASIEGHDADKRAEIFSRQLETKASSGDEISVTLQIRNKSPVILLNDQYLMTVTPEDAQLNNNGISPRRQAEIWIKIISQEIEYAQQERRASQSRVPLAFFLILLISIVTVAINWISRKVSKTRFLGKLNSLRPIANVTSFFAKLTIWLMGIIYIATLFPLTRRWLYFFQIKVSSAIFGPSITIESSETYNEYSLFEVTLFCLILLFLIRVIVYFSNQILRDLLSILNFSEEDKKMYSAISGYILTGFGIVILFNIFEVDLRLLAIIGGAAGIGIGFGVQGFARDLISGLLLVIDKPFVAGDFIELDRFTGTVESVGVRTTKVKTTNNLHIVVPNAQFMEQDFVNWSHQRSESGIYLPLSIDSEENILNAQIIIRQAVNSHSEVLHIPETQVLVENLDLDSIQLKVLTWIKKPDRQAAIKNDLYILIKNALEKNEIEFSDE